MLKKGIKKVDLYVEHLIIAVYIINNLFTAELRQALNSLNMISPHCRETFRVHFKMGIFQKRKTKTKDM